MASAEKAVDAVVEFGARVLYTVVTRRISHDRAFQAVLREYRKAARYVSLKVLFQSSRWMVSDYYLLRFLEQRIYGGRGGAKRLARLWVALRSQDTGVLPGWMEDGVARLRRRLLRSMPRRVEDWREVVDEVEEPVQRLAVTHSFPEWMVERLVELLGLGEAERLLEALNEEQWWIRVNTLKADVDTVVRSLEEKGVVVQRDPDLPYMLRVVDYAEPLHHLEEMWRGEIVFQDKASALVVEALEPEPGDTILDLASAPGVKDGLIMQLTGNRARIIAVDVSWQRLKRQQRLLRLYGVDLARVELVNADSTTLHLNIEPDKVILDAPCSSSGAVGKDPAIKIHMETPDWLHRFPPLQSQLLSKALSYRAVTVYATCSIMPEEGEEIVAKHQDRLVEPRIPGSPGYNRYGFNKLVRRLHPHTHNTQGFFIARLDETK